MHRVALYSRKTNTYEVFTLIHRMCLLTDDYYERLTRKVLCTVYSVAAVHVSCAVFKPAGGLSNAFSDYVNFVHAA